MHDPASCAVLVVCYQNVVANRASLLVMYISLYTKLQRRKFGWSLCGHWSVNIFDHNSRLAVVWRNFLIYSKCKYLHVKIDSLDVKSYVTVGPSHWWQIYGPVLIPCKLSACTVDTSMITVSSCGVIVQWVLRLSMHVHFCGFSFIYYIIFISTLTQQT